MANKLIPIKQFCEEMAEDLNRMPPALRALAIYRMQISLGGFPVNRRELDRLLKAADDELEKQQ